MDQNGKPMDPGKTKILKMHHFPQSSLLQNGPCQRVLSITKGVAILSALLRRGQKSPHDPNNLQNDGFSKVFLKMLKHPCLQVLWVPQSCARKCLCGDCGPCFLASFISRYPKIVETCSFPFSQRKKQRKPNIGTRPRGGRARSKSWMS